VLVAEGRGIKVSPGTTVEDRITDDVARHPVRTSRRTPGICDYLTKPQQLLRNDAVLTLAPAAIPFLLVAVPFTDEAEITPDSTIKFNKRNFCQMSLHMEMLGREPKTSFKIYSNMQTASILISPLGS